MARALTVVAEGSHPDIAKHLKGFGSAVLELALKFRGDAYRVVYVRYLGRPRLSEEVQERNQDAQSGDHSIHERLRRLKEMLK
jgi:phage-related protein